MLMTAPLGCTSTQDADKHIVVGAIRNHHGLELSPAPCDDPRDPLRWSRSLKYAAIAAASLTNFVGNITCAGPATATRILQAEFGKSAERVNDLLSVGFMQAARLTVAREADGKEPKTVQFPDACFR
jgi:hypothetical protein